MKHEKRRHSKQREFFKTYLKPREGWHRTFPYDENR
jgi:hypothetical protein